MVPTSPLQGAPGLFTPRLCTESPTGDSESSSNPVVILGKLQLQHSDLAGRVFLSWDNTRLVRAKCWHADRGWLSLSSDTSLTKGHSSPEPRVWALALVLACLYSDQGATSRVQHPRMAVVATGVFHNVWPCCQLAGGPPAPMPIPTDSTLPVPGSTSHMAVSIPRAFKTIALRGYQALPICVLTWPQWHRDLVLRCARYKMNSPCSHGPLCSLCPQDPPLSPPLMVWVSYRQSAMTHSSLSNNNVATFSWLWEPWN